jgi:hypothetical protein
MSVIHIPEAEAAKDIGSVLERVGRGEEIVIDRAAASVRLLPESKFTPRTLKEMIAILESLPGQRGVVDADFAADARSFRERHPEGLRNPWE